MQKPEGKCYPQGATVILLKSRGGHGVLGPTHTMDCLSHWGSLETREMATKWKLPLEKSQNLRAKSFSGSAKPGGVIKGLTTTPELQRNFWPIDQSPWLTTLAQWTHRLIQLHIFRTLEKNPSGSVLSHSIMLSDKVWEERLLGLTVTTGCHRPVIINCAIDSHSCTFCHAEGLGLFRVFFFS